MTFSAGSTPTRRVRRTQRDRSEETSSELVEAARALFARDGYAATSMDAVCERAGVSKGAAYYHFRNKQDLFAAVYAREEKDLARLVARAYLAEGEPWAGIRAGCRKFLEASLDPGIQRITLLDAPGALGWDVMREIQASGRGQMRTGLTAVAQAGGLAADEVDAMASLLHGAMCEAATVVAHDEEPQQALARTFDALDAIFDGLARRGARPGPNGVPGDQRL